MSDRRSAHRAAGRQSVTEWYVGRQVTRSVSSPASVRGMQTPPHSHRSSSKQSPPHSHRSSSRDMHRSPPHSYRSHSVEGTCITPQSSRSQQSRVHSQHQVQQQLRLCDRPGSKESSPRPNLLFSQSKNSAPLGPLPAGIKPLCFEAWAVAEEVCVEPVKQPVAYEAAPSNFDVRAHNSKSKPARGCWLLCMAIATGIMIIVAAGIAFGAFVFDGQAAASEGNLLPASGEQPSSVEAWAESSTSIEFKELRSNDAYKSDAVEGTLVIMAADAASFAQDPRSKQAIKSCIAKQVSGVDASMVRVKSIRLARRLSEVLRGRRLQMQRVDVDYVIMLGEDVVTTPASVADTLQNLDPREMTQNLSGELESLGMQHEFEVTLLSAESAVASEISVVQIASPAATSSTPLPSSTSAAVVHLAPLSVASSTPLPSSTPEAASAGTISRSPTSTILAAFAAPETYVAAPSTTSTVAKAPVQPMQYAASAPAPTPAQRPETQPLPDDALAEHKEKPHGHEVEKAKYGQPKSEQEATEPKGPKKEDCDDDKKQPESREGNSHEGSEIKQPTVMEANDPMQEQKEPSKGKGGKGR